MLKRIYGLQYGSAFPGNVPDIRCASVLLAVSGGIDSMCMADLFLRSSCSPDFVLAHCNFHLRGAESDSDEALVAEWAEEHGIRLHKKDFDTAAYASEHGLSIEMAARELRYRWFGELASVNGYSAVAVAHNANDNAETLILNMLRGTGIKGVTGMGELSANPCCQGVVIRPLLHFTRKQIEGHVLAHGLRYHEDSTNADVEYRRNRIRNQIFPLFAGINPSFVKTLNREMDYFSQAADIADEYFREHSSCMTECPENGAGGVVCRVDVAALKAERHWKYILYRVLEQYGFNSASVHSVCVLLEEAGTIGGKVFRSGGHELMTSSRELVIRKAGFDKGEGRQSYASGSGSRIFRERDTLSASDPVMAIRAAGKYFFNGVSFSVSVRKWDGSISLKQPAGTIMFDRAVMDFPFICRRWLPGDWMRPLGLKGRKKLSDMFTDMKYGPEEKESAVVLVAPSSVLSSPDAPEHHVSALLGVRIDDSLKVTSSTKEVIIISIDTNSFHVSE
ncbi:MAG: tRNA lysidine(34) synthetase TilS [Bacteroidetes bacterium]|uniref:tRNA(Ile)-lysidine synthase n=1 Tax=Candidatus Cryptobacteroides merdavium TaxID=2840769 RepID=A0A9D9HBL2_9BACT|nr:tRNA lysidine(34) synthetase TilS [Candidatus Cryptobacteroides merdavium]